MSVTTFTEEELEAIEGKWTITRFIFFPAGLFGLYFLAHPWPTDHWAMQAFWSIYTGYVLFCWTSCFHETAHQTLSGSRRLSLILGRGLGTIIGAPYSVYRESHIRHHAYLNKPTDWELWPYSDPNTSVWFRRIFVWIDLFLGGFTAPLIYGRTFFHKNSPITDKKLRRIIWWEYLGIVAFWGSILAVVATCNAWELFVKVWVIPHMVAGFMQTIRKLTEHLGMASYDPLKGTRTVVGASWVTKICTFLNFDIFVHGPHHRHPRVAHNQLREKMRDYVDSHPDDKFPIYRTYLQATASMIPWMFRNPGVGMCVGAPAPRSEKASDVDNFVADVSEEVLKGTQLERPEPGGSA